MVALRKESVDRNHGGFLAGVPVPRSLSARRAWIEMPGAAGRFLGLWVALRKESVDRNQVVGSLAQLCCVALRKESVDRNDCPGYIGTADPASLSARRAWIEIRNFYRHIKEKCRVALRKESVDRNCNAGNCTATQTASLSARRAWIEIRWLLSLALARNCRSPQGERG